MKNAKSMSSTSLEVLAKSLSMRLTLDELEWLWRELKEQAEEKRSQVGEEGPLLADYRHVWGPTRERESRAGCDRGTFENSVQAKFVEHPFYELG